jgi:hypothetical protein
LQLQPQLQSLHLGNDPPNLALPSRIQSGSTFAILVSEHVLLLPLAALSLAPARVPLPFSPACPELFAKGHQSPVTPLR